ncbi:hypothetical protein L1987_06311 [Smallanthus sonchifolius]|uniref:Uncharacterized protein n=1 Tax=Smallanthus sonchifolius TaxID=185202 RepID=A0ACB9JY03_9ASTR|nr:hypothetical protein L1987_06311 [Smallanthus sonchifolius]
MPQWMITWWGLTSFVGLMSIVEILGAHQRTPTLGIIMQATGAGGFAAVANAARSDASSVVVATSFVDSF